MKKAAGRMLFRPRPALVDSAGNPLFFDDFDYVVDKGVSGVDSGKGAAFAAGGGWTGAFQDETTRPSGEFGSLAGAKGFLYTVPKNAIPGHESTPCPGSGSRVLCIESLSGTYGNQTDFYLQSPGGAPGSLPANLWVQFWMLVNRTGSQMSAFESIAWIGGGKFLYALHAGDDGAYPNATEETAWLVGLTPIAINPNTGAQIQPPEAGAITFRNAANEISPGVPRAYWELLEGNDPQSMYANVEANDRWIRPNEWNLIRMQMDISTSVGQWNVWRRKYGEQAGGLLKICEFIPGTTPGFTYATSANDRLGPRVFRIPTTSARADFEAPFVVDPDYFMYLADVCYADNADDLPTYGSY